MDNNNLFMYANAIIWLIALCIYIQKNGFWTLGFGILTLYTLIAFVSIDLYNSEYSHFFFKQNLTLQPFLYLFLMIILTSYPILQIKEKSINTIILPNKKIINFITVVVVAFSFLRLFQIFPSIKTGITLILLDSNNALDMYNDSTNLRMTRNVSSGGFDYLSIFSNLFLAISPFVFYINLIIPKRNKIFLGGIILSLFVMPLNGIANASRILMVMVFFEIFMLLLFFRRFISYRVKRVMFTILSLLGGIVLFFFILITIGRSSNNNINYQVFAYERYFAEGPLVFNNYCMNANGTREGYITFPLIKYLLGEEMLNESELRYRYSTMKMDNSRFSTYVGDYVLDFGVLTTSFLFIAFSLFLTKRLKVKNKISITQLILLYFTFRFTTGFFQYQYSALSGNVLFFSLLLTFYFFKWYSRYDRHKIYIKAYK